MSNQSPLFTSHDTVRGSLRGTCHPGTVRDIRLPAIPTDTMLAKGLVDIKIPVFRETLDSPLGLARHAAALHQVAHLTKDAPLSVGNWIPSPLEPKPDGCTPPFHVPDPGGDAYLAGLNVAALDQREEALSPRLMPGWINHLQNIGVVPQDARVHEVDLSVREVSCPEDGDTSLKLAGYPHTDILSQAVSQGVRLNPGQLVSATFPTPFVAEQIERLGGNLIQRSNASQTNNKHLFREAAKAYGFSVFPGCSFSSSQELLSQTEHLQEVAAITRASGRNPRFIARLKDPCSSGGDGVRGIEAPISSESMRSALNRLLDGINRSYLLGDYGAVSERHNWNPSADNSFPRPLILEHDASTVGEVLFNGSFMVEIHEDGRYAVPRYFGQKTDREGSFRGGYTVNINAPRWSGVFNERAQELLNQSIDGVVRYWYQELGVRGMAGVDFMLVRRHEDGNIVPYLFDPNVRPTINSISSVIARKVERALGFPAWENLNGWAPTPLTSMKDFEALLNLGNGLDFYNGCKYGIVVPIAHRAMFNRSSDGDISCVQPSNAAKFLIAARNEATVERISTLLNRVRGLRYSSDEQ